MTNYGPGQPPPPPGQPPQGYPVPGQPAPGQQGYPPQPYAPAAPPQPQYQQPQYQQPPPAAHPAPYVPEPPPGGPQRPGTIVGNPRPAGPTFQAPNPPGKRRGTVAVILLSIFTVFIYSLYWHAKVFQELRRRRDRGPGGGIGFFSALSIVGAWLLPGTIRDAYVEAGREPPVSSMTGWWNLLPLVGWFVWVAKCNGALNRLWEGS